MKIRIYLCIIIAGLLAFQQDTRAATDPLTCELDRILDPTVICSTDSTPVVTLVGSATVNIIKGGRYTEEGARWTDSVDGAGFISAPTSGWVDVNTLGTYTLQYKYTNSSSKTSNIVTRRVIVGSSITGNSSPRVTLVGSSTVNIVQGGRYTEEGARWTDTVDGAGFISAPTSGWVDVNTPGSYTLQYKYISSSSKTSNIVIRTVNVGNSNPPPSPTSLPAMTGIYGESLSSLSQSNDGTYNITYNPTNKFFRAEGQAKYSSKERVIRITTNRNAYYVQTPIRTDGSWTVFDTTTPGWVLSAFLQEGMNTLTISYYNKDTKTFITSGAQKITIYVQ